MTAEKLIITFAQMNSIVGDITGNLKRMQEFANKAKDEYAADLIVFPELVISGYPPEDLLFRKDFIDGCYMALQTYASNTAEICSIVGVPLFENGSLKNAAVFIKNGKINAIYHKQKLPNYGVFDEKRYFSPGEVPCIIQLNGVSLGLAICEDIWSSSVIAQFKDAGVDIIISLNASPFEINKHAVRMEVLQARTQEASLPILYVNCAGGQDELIFDGDSMLIDPLGNAVINLPCFQESLGAFQFNINNAHLIALSPNSNVSSFETTEVIYQALKLGVHDYVKKNGFSRVIVGSSGGIDSAVTLAIAVDALGAENVSAVMMPSKFTVQMSLDDAEALAKNLGINHQIIPITENFNSFLSTLSNQFINLSIDKTEENLQARCRGTILMALSNKQGALVLITGNRSEMAVGYATLYGDMAGGFAVLKDVYKTTVYQLAKYINQKYELIPNNILLRPPSAELADDQKDEDSLPPYSILDQILSLYLNQEMSIDDIVKQGFDRVLIQEIVKMIHLNEYKRKQAPPGIRIHHKAFGRDRRYPITQRFRCFNNQEA